MKYLIIYCLIALAFELTVITIGWLKSKNKSSSKIYIMMIKSIFVNKQIKVQFFNPLFWIFLVLFLTAMLCVIFPVDFLMHLQKWFGKKKKDPVDEYVNKIFDEPGGPLDTSDFFKEVEKEFIPQPPIVITLTNTNNEAQRVRFLNAKEVDYQYHPLMPEGVEISVESVEHCGELIKNISYPYKEWLASLLIADEDELTLDALIYHEGDTNKDILFGYTYKDKPEENVGFSFNIDNYKSSFANPDNGSNYPIWVYCFKFDKLNYALKGNSYFELGMHPGETIKIELIKKYSL